MKVFAAMSALVYALSALFLVSRNWLVWQALLGAIPMAFVIVAWLGALLAGGMAVSRIMRFFK